MPEFDFEGFLEGIDTLDDGMDRGSEYADGFQPFDPETQNDDEG